MTETPRKARGVVYKELPGRQIEFSNQLLEGVKERVAEYDSGDGYVTYMSVILHLSYTPNPQYLS